MEFFDKRNDLIEHQILKISINKNRWCSKFISAMFSIWNGLLECFSLGDKSDKDWGFISADVIAWTPLLKPRAQFVKFRKKIKTSRKSYEKCSMSSRTRIAYSKLIHKRNFDKDHLWSDTGMGLGIQAIFAIFRYLDILS